MKKYFFAIATILIAQPSLAQDILPPKPKGPTIKADAIENYQWMKQNSSNDYNKMVSFYKAGDYLSATNFAEKLSAKGDMNATALLGFINEMGLGMAAPDFTTAVKLYRKAIALGSLDAMIGLGRIASIGEGDIPILEATNALETAIAAKREDAIMPMADLLIRSNVDRARGFALYQGLAAAHNDEAAYKAAILLDDGDAAPFDDPITAQTYLQQAANGNIAAAQADLGLFYYLGRAGPKNLISAANWFKKAAENGDKNGAFYWALVNAKAEGVERNFEIALKYANQARDTVPEAQKLYDQLLKYTKK